MRVPVHQTLAAIDQALVVHFHKDLDHGIVEIPVLIGFRCAGCARHGKGVARPVTGRSQPFQLVDDRIAILALPFPDFFQKIIAAHVAATG